MVTKRERIRELLQEAINILQEPEPARPSPAHPVPEDGETVELVGTIGRPEYKEVKGIPLFTAGIGVRRVDGKLQWFDLQAWRATAIWARENLHRGAQVKAHGSWKQESWTNREGETKSREVFNVTHFEAEVEAA